MEKLHALKLIRIVDFEDMAESVTCDPTSKDLHMCNMCPKCKDQEFAIAKQGDLQDYHAVQITRWSTEKVIRENKH